MKIIRYPDFKKSDLKTFVIAGDWHSFSMNQPSYSILKQVLSDLNKPILIINGDFIDAEYLMFKLPIFKKWQSRGFEGVEDFFIPMLDAECDWGNDILDEVQKLCEEVIFIFGNHDWRVDQYGLNFAPKAYKHYFKLQDRLRLKDRGIRMVGYNNWLDIDEVSITHGQFHGATAHKKHYEACGGRTVIFSHIHRFEQRAMQVRGSTRYSISLPAMCDLNPEYMKNQDNNWSNGFGTMSFFKGNNNINVLNVWDGKLITPLGKIYAGL